MTKWADVKFREGKLFVSSFSQTVAGFLMPNEWIEMTVEEAPDQELGRLVLAALDASKQNMPTPDPDQRSNDPTRKLLKLAGIKSHKQFAIGALAVSIRLEESDGKIELTPMRNLGPREGLDYLVNESFEETELTEEAVGNAVRRALDRAI